MKKYLKLMFILAFALVVVACADDDNGNGAADNGDNGNGETGEVVDVRVALIAHSTDSILDDGSFNQGAWDGIVRFFEENDLDLDADAGFYLPTESSDEARIDLIGEAVDAGYNVLVLPGFHFESALYSAQSYFPDVAFILLDASPRNEDGEAVLEDNVAAIHYAEEEAGFLAGYAAVMEGYRNLGFTGGIAVPPVVRYGHGFIQGAEHAAESLGLEAGEVQINFTYLGAFAPDPDFMVATAAWYTSGTEVIFTAAGGAGGSVMAAAEQENGSVIGVDVDQYHLSDTIITSAMKGLDVSVFDMLMDFMNGEFNGGNELRFDASLNGVGLALENARLENFTQAQYDEIFSALQGGDVEVSSSLDFDDIDVELVNVIVID